MRVRHSKGMARVGPLAPETTIEELCVQVAALGTVYADPQQIELKSASQNEVLARDETLTAAGVAHGDVLLMRIAVAPPAAPPAAAAAQTTSPEQPALSCTVASTTVGAEASPTETPPVAQAPHDPQAAPTATDPPLVDWSVPYYGNEPEFENSLGEMISTHAPVREIERVITSNNALYCKIGGYYTPLHKAARVHPSGHADVIKMLLDKGVPVDLLNGHGETALHDAAEWGRIDAMRVLVERGADVNAINPRTHATPLHRACNKKKSDAVEVLIGAGAKLEMIQENDRATPLLVAASWGAAECVTLLVAAGADIEAKDKNGWDLLQTAADGGHKREVEAALALGLSKKQQ